MATPRQRRKVRSGSSTTPSAKSKRSAQKKLVRVPTIKGAQVIQDNWDPKLTVRQNYQKLGLLGDLSMRDSGGKEKGQRLAQLPESVGKKGAKRGAMARVERDSEGNLVIVDEMKADQKASSKETAWGPALNSDDEEEEEEDRIDDDKVAEDDDDDENEKEDEDDEEEVEKNTEVTDSLEALSKTITPVPRFTSQAEKSWLHRLVAKHGENTTAMARDRVDNVWQRTEGEIKRAIKKAGGLSALQS